MAASRLLFTTEDGPGAHAGRGERVRRAARRRRLARTTAVRAAARTSLGIELETQLIVCVTDRLGARRASGTALRTLALLAERHPDMRLALVRPGSDDDDVRMHAAALGVSSLVHFLGERDDLPLVLARGRRRAGSPPTATTPRFACLDFMAARVPVIAERSPLVAHYVPMASPACCSRPPIRPTPRRRSRRSSPTTISARRWGTPVARASQRDFTEAR